jgi:uncharacterized membrane protein YedE/YeeE
MKHLKYIIAGAVFGLALTKGEAISWFRIIEMFRFENFQMFGIFMTAIPTGALSLLLIKKLKLKTISGEQVDMPKKEYHHGTIIGGLIFGFGWALTGACPGPLYVQIGAGCTVAIATLLSAIAGTWVFGRVQKYLPD